ncbi:MAG: GNAT family N-acetyltransferase [Bacteroidetes bacterium]|nr:GNAT family N-acetyltransferase [Bacteroidota bacterium]
MLSDNNIKLRALEPSDIDWLYKWENDISVWQVSNTLTPYSRHVLEQYILNAQLDIYTTKQLRLIICINEPSSPLQMERRPGGEAKVIGCVDLFDFDPHNKRAGVGILIADKTERGNGYASAALALLTNYAFKILSLQQLYCNVSVDNKASLKLFAKHKFETVGVKKKWINDGGVWKDECLMQLVAGSGFQVPGSGL